MAEQSTRHIMMMEPADFHANPQTFETNHFQEPDPDNIAAVNRAAVGEFRNFRDTLIESGVVVTTVRGQKGCPDDIFVNNWVSTHAGGKMVLYPMLAENRRIERRPVLVDLLRQTYDVALDLTVHEKAGSFLESTGALVMDRVHKIAYCALSGRADRSLAEKWCKKMRYRPVFFNTSGPTGGPVYHTDVLMFIGTGYAGLCTDCIVPEDRARVLETIGKTHDVIDISMEQLTGMCGNALELKNTQDEKLLVMSSAAYNSFTDQQKNQFLQYVEKIVHADIPTIEKYGGGSARCMLLELY